MAKQEPRGDALKQLKAALKALGADINSDVSRKTQILVVGATEVGPSKIKKAEEYGIRIMYESELKEYLTTSKIDTSVNSFS